MSHPLPRAPSASLPLLTQMDKGKGKATPSSGKRTRGPRSCDQCRISKQRCEQLDVAGIVPSNDPQPFEMACRRCRVLQLPCIVADMLPKSTRMRMERAAAVAATTVTDQSLASSSAATMANTNNVSQAKAPSCAASTISSTSSPPFSRQSLSDTPRLSVSRHRFDPQIFDPTPALQRGDGDSSFSSPADRSASMLGRSHDSSAESSATNTTMTSAANAGKSIDFMQRAKIATRPLCLLEHLCPPNVPEREHPGLDMCPPLALAVGQILQAQGSQEQLSRRFNHIRTTSMPFLPDVIHLMRADNEHGIFLLAVGITIEGLGKSHNLSAVLRHHIASHCAGAMQRMPLDVHCICALLLVALYCPHLARSAGSTQPLQLGSHALLTTCAEAATAMGMPSACDQLRSQLDGPGASFPPIDGPVLLATTMCIFIEYHLSLLELLGEGHSLVFPSLHGPVRSSFAPSQTQTATLGQQLFHADTLREHLDISERYFKMLLMEESVSEQVHSDTIVQQCANHLLANLRARLCLNYSQATQELLIQLQEQQIIWRGTGDRATSSPAATNALRRWAEQAVASITLITTSATEESHRLMTVVGTHAACDVDTLAYVEAEIASYEFLAVSRFKDRMFDAGIAIMGPCKTSQEFLYGIFSVPSLLKPYEEMGIFRTSAAKHVLILLDNLAVEVKLNLQRDQDQNEYYHMHGAPTMRWKSVASVMPTPRWVGIIVSCATALAEEVAGRFMAQMPPMGARNDSRFEITLMILTQSIFLVEELIREDNMHHVEHDDKGNTLSSGTYMKSALESLRAIRISLARWRKQATGVGHYTRASRSTGVDENTWATSTRNPLRLPGTDIASLLQANDANASAAALSDQSFGRERHATAYNGSLRKRPSVLTTDTFGRMNNHFAQEKQSGIGSMPIEVPSDATAAGPQGHAPTPQNFGQAPFADALLADILFTPIETFFRGNS